MTTAGRVVHVFATKYPRYITVGSQQFTPIDRHVGTNRCILPWAFLYGNTLQPAALQDSLAHTLNTFPSLAGRVEPVKSATSGITCLGSSSSTTRATWQLLLCNKGVPFSVHSSKCTLEEFRNRGCMNSRKGFTFPTNSNECLPDYMEGAAPVVSVRLTQLSGGGSILAVTAAHVVMDGRSSVRFLRAWAQAYDSLMAAVAVSCPRSAAAAVSEHDLKATSPGNDNGACNGAATAPADAVAAVALAAATESRPQQLQQHVSQSVRLITSTSDAVDAAEADSHEVFRKTSAAAVPADKDAALAVALPLPSNAAADEASSVAHKRCNGASLGARQPDMPPSPNTEFSPIPCTRSPSLSYSNSNSNSNSNSSSSSSSSPDNIVDPLLPSCVPPPGWMSAVKAVRAAHNRLKAEDKHIASAAAQASSIADGTLAATCAGASAPRTTELCKDISSLETVLLHIPAVAVHDLKTAGSVLCGGGEFISSNDAVSALVWMLMCYLRNRPMPGQHRPTHMQDSYFGVALDLRTAAAAATTTTTTTTTRVSDNDQTAASIPVVSISCSAHSAAPAPHHNTSTTCKTSSHTHAQFPQPKQQTSHTNHNIPMSFFGNASWSISVPSMLGSNNASGQSADEPSPLSVPWHARLMPQDLDMICSNHNFLIKSLAAGAMSIRSALQAMRADEKFTMNMLQQVEDSLTAPLSSQVSHLAGFVRKLDGFVTSWQFEIWDIRFGGQDVLGFQGIVHPVPPYHAVVLPAPCSTAAAKPAATEEHMLQATPAGRPSMKRERELQAGGDGPAAAAAAADHVSAEVCSNSGKGAVGVGSSSSDGVLLWLTVPQCLVPVMKSSPVLRLLVPDAHWLSCV